MERRQGEYRKDNFGLEYFANIFKSDNPSNFDVSLNSISNRVIPNMNEELLAEFKAKEVWRALQQMHPTKALSSDGMSPIFYKKYWDIIGFDVVQCALDALNYGVLPCGLNETYICLIPKVKSPQKIIEFRPISYI